MSMKPGHTTSPEGISTTVAPLTGKSRPTRAIRLPSMRTSCTPSIPLAGSITRPPLSSFFMFGPACQQIQHRHPHRYTISNLVEDDGIWTVSDFGGNFHPAVHRTRVHDHHVGLGQSQPRLSHSEDAEILSQRREVGAFHPFELNPQEHHHVGIGN